MEEGYLGVKTPPKRILHLPELIDEVMEHINDRRFKSLLKEHSMVVYDNHEESLFSLWPIGEKILPSLNISSFRAGWYPRKVLIDGKKYNVADIISVSEVLPDTFKRLKSVLDGHNYPAVVVFSERYKKAVFEALFNTDYNKTYFAFLKGTTYGIAEYDASCEQWYVLYEDNILLPETRSYLRDMGIWPEGYDPRDNELMLYSFNSTLKALMQYPDCLLYTSPSPRD